MNILAHLYTALASIGATQEAQHAHSVYRYVHDFLKVYSLIQDLPLPIQAAWLGTLVVLMLMQYDLKIARDSLLPNPPHNPAAIRPLRLFLRRAILVTVVFVMACLFGPQVALGSALVYLVLMGYYFLAGFLVIGTTLISTLNVLEF